MEIKYTISEAYNKIKMPKNQTIIGIIITFFPEK